MRDDNLLVERRERVATIIIDRPEKRNALSRKMKTRLADTVADLSRDGEVSVVVIRGAGREAFSAGADLSEFDASESPEARSQANDGATALCMRAIRDCPKPVIAMVYGFAMGGGCLLAMACDLRVAAESARFAITTARLGIVYAPEVVAHLVQLVGPSNAARMTFTGTAFDARTCKEMGLATLVYPDDCLEEETYRLARQIAENPPESIASAKVAITTFMRDPRTRGSLGIQN